MSTPTPLLEFFKRGDVPREVRQLAAQGALAPRAYEQLAILVHLQDDPDPEVRSIAQQTLDRIPVGALRTFLGRSEVSIGVREFFADRGVFPDEIPTITVDEPLIAAASEPSGGSGADAVLEDDDDGAPLDDAARESLLQKISKMNFTERIKAALKGSREMRAILIRDPNKMVAASVLASPKLTESEVESIAKMANVSDEVLRIIAANRAWTKNYIVVVGLTKNPKTPVALSLNLMHRLNDKDLTMLSTDRNVPEPVRIAARRKVSLGESRR